MGIKLSSQGLKQIDLARKQRGWTKADPHWLVAAHTSEPTMRRFWRRTPIRLETFQEICAAIAIDWHQVAERPFPSPDSPSTTLDPQFVGRETAINDLQQLGTQGHKLILIQGEGGVGKTTLTRKFLQLQSFDRILELAIGIEPDHVPSVELVLEEWLRRYFQEEPGREFGISLDRLRRQLQDPRHRVGILLDRLETVLQNGRFLPNHRRYIQLLNTLSHPDVQSLTLIASRELLYEPGIILEAYRLKPLNQAAWQQFFKHRHITAETAALEEMHRAYGGNAEAMCILAQTIDRDFDGNLDAYWERHREYLLLHPTLSHLVENQFNKLRRDAPQTHRLLCRLGCYRYQAIPTIPEAGLFGLLWDVPESQHKAVVQALQNCALVRVHNNRYCLNPAIRSEAIAQLKSEVLGTGYRQHWENMLARDRLRQETDSENVPPLNADDSQTVADLSKTREKLTSWHLANRAAGEFYLQWYEAERDEMPTATTYAFEAIAHFAIIEDFEKCYQVLHFHILKAEKLENLRCSPDLWNNMSRIRHVSEKLYDKLSQQQAASIQIPLTIIYAEGGRNRQAIAINQQILDRIAQQPAPDGETRFLQLSAYSIISKSYRYMGNFKQAEIACIRARKIAAQSGNSSFQAIALYGFGSLYLALDKPRKALRYLIAAAASAQFGGMTRDLKRDLKQIVQLLAKPFRSQTTEIQSLIERYNLNNRDNRIKKFNILWSAIRCFNKLQFYEIAKIVIEIAENLIQPEDGNQQCLLALERATYFAWQRQGDRVRNNYQFALKAASHPSQVWCRASALKQYGDWLYQIAEYAEALERYQQLNQLLADTDFDALKAHTLYCLALTSLQREFPDRTKILNNLIEAKAIAIDLGLHPLLEDLNRQLNRLQPDR